MTAKLSCHVLSSAQDHIAFLSIFVLAVCLYLWGRCCGFKRCISKRDDNRGEYRELALELGALNNDYFDDDISIGGSVDGYSGDMEDNLRAGPKNGGTVELSSIHKKEMNGGIDLEEMNG